MKKILTFTLLLIHVFPHAQVAGGNPPEVKWKQLRLAPATIIYPTGLDSVAVEIASVITGQQLRNKGNNNTLPSIPVVLQKNSTNSNGYVGLSPWRSEFYLTPPLDNFSLGTTSWATTLAIHEYRHAQQFGAYRKGLSKIAYWLFGQEGQAIANSAAVPDWFFEGDAVREETQYSFQGRGRIGFFFNGYRSLWQKNVQYTYMKLRNGSLKNYVPNHYQLGYLLTSYGAEQYGEAFWDKVTDDAVQFRGLFYPFQKAIKKHSGINFTTFREATFNFFERQQPPDDTSVITLINTPKRYVEHYNFPTLIGKDSILVVKHSYQKVKGWYIMDPVKQTEKRIRTKDISRDDYYNHNNGAVVYTAFTPHARWGLKDYNNIKILDLNTQKVTQITRKGKYFQPALSPDNRQIVAISFTPDHKNALHILNAETGVPQKSVPAENGFLFTFPQFYTPDSLITFLRDNKGKMAIQLIDVNTQSKLYLSDFDYSIKGYPSLKGDTLFYTASKDGYDNLYALHIPTKKINLLTTCITGAYQATANDSTVWWSTVTANGNRIQQKAINKLLWQPIKPDTLFNGGLPYMNNIQSYPTAFQFSDSAYPAGHTYSKWTKPFNFHSWRPYYERPDWSLTLYGQNVLNTFQSSVAYTFNENERSHQIGLNGALFSWFPYISFGGSYTVNRFFSDSSTQLKWNESTGYGGFQIPLNVSGGRWFRTASVASHYFVNRTDFTEAPHNVSNKTNQYIQTSFNWYSRVQQATQHIFPRQGQQVFARLRNLLNGKGYQLLASGNWYLPGILPTHHIVLQGAYQARDTTLNYRFGNSFPISRGYLGYDHPRMAKIGVNYHLPIVYPDWGFGNMLYFTRIRANLFYDYTRLNNKRNRQWIPLQSAGVELFADTKWWNQQTASFGVRFSYAFDYNIANYGTPYRWDIILPVDLIRP